MNKRYQVFVSSTFTDLEEERQKAFQTLMNLEYFPAGMELFPALDQEQFEYIKRTIDDCDYYVLIIGGRYGTISSEGVSYTEKEYDYAVACGIPVIALIHDKPEMIPAGKSEKSVNSLKQLDGFKAKVKSGRLVKYWNTPEQLSINLMQSLIHTTRVYPRSGWIKGSEVNNSELLAEIHEIRKENERLKALKTSSTKGVALQIPDLADLAEAITLKYKANIQGKSEILELKGISLRQIFSFLSPYLVSGLFEHEVKSSLSEFAESIITPKPKDPALTTSDFHTLQIQFSAMRLIDLMPANDEWGNRSTMWRLSEFGVQEMYRVRTIRKKS